MKKVAFYTLGCKVNQYETNAMAQKFIEKGYKIGNIDCTIIAQAPKMASHIPTMRINIAKALNTDIDNINVKATTEEGLGFTGAKEGIAAQSICLLVKVDK